MDDESGGCSEEKASGPAVERVEIVVFDSVRRESFAFGVAKRWCVLKM
jgi:hypothetical protein